MDKQLLLVDHHLKTAVFWLLDIYCMNSRSALQEVLEKESKRFNPVDS